MDACSRSFLQDKKFKELKVEGMSAFAVCLLWIGMMIMMVQFMSDKSGLNTRSLVLFCFDYCLTSR